ncbi:MAG: hypothetical protein V4760_15360 [Bdellovibrionota bacterium]
MSSHAQLTVARFEAPSTVRLVFGNDVAPRIRERVTELMSRVTSSRTIVEQDASSVSPAPGDWVLSFGETPVTRKLLSREHTAQQGPEGFVVRSAEENGVVYLVADGNAAEGERVSMVVNRGLSFGVYEVLQRIGFRFWHPFTPRAPSALRFNGPLDLKEKPRWPIRGFHLHTMHPIELTHVLNAWGPGGPDDAKGWESLLPEWDLYLEWSIAHRQNIVQWALLADKKHLAFNDSPERLTRLTKLVKMAHRWGVVTGIDVGIVLEQQNTWRLIRKTGKLADELSQIKTRVNWLMRTGMDYLAAEMGFSEFQPADDQKMLDWMNAVTREVEDVYNRPCYMKIHVSRGQHSKKFKDPDTKAPLNFNFLPHYADKRLVVMPHTVELYSLDDPAPTYGNKDFSEIRRFTSLEAGSRPVVFYPEVGYWVSYDVDVPLFLPSYAERRLHDLRLLASDEDEGRLGRGSAVGSKIQGQIVFSSGFEWGYWFPHLVAAASAWNPRTDITDGREAWKAIVHDVFRSEGDARAEELVNVLTQTVREQHALLIEGKVAGLKPRQIEKLNGMAYLSGQDTWGELNTVLHDVFKFPHAATSPNRAPAKAFRKSKVFKGLDYSKDITPLLKEMETSFEKLARDYDRLAMNPPEDLAPEMKEFRDGAWMNALRAKQVRALYDAEASVSIGRDSSWRQARIDTAKAALDEAAEIANERASEFRTDYQRNAGWGTNPTVYRYAYLWTAQNLFYWRRDEGRVVTRPKNLCYMNIINPAEVAFASGQKNVLYRVLSTVAKLPGFGSVKACLSPSPLEPKLGR